MAQKAVMDAVSARLGNPWVSGVDGSSIPIFDQNIIGVSPSDGSPFIEVQYPVANAEQKSIGAPGSQVWREDGAIRFVVSIQRSEGTAQGMGWCDEIAALFRGRQFNGVNTWAPTSPVLDNSNDNGNFWLLTFVVPYYFDIIG